jgi:hypothetical protein
VNDQSRLCLRRPKNDLLMKIYEEQVKRLQLIVDEIIEIEELSEVFFSSFEI